MVLGCLDEDDQEHLGATKKHWHALVRAQAPVTAQDALALGHRHGLARALGAPADATAFITRERDDYGMTRLMHAARRPPNAMLGCLLHHCAEDMQQSDIANLTARDWAVLSGYQLDFDRALEQARPIPAPYVANYNRVNIDFARRLGHRPLITALLGAHYVSDYPWQAPYRVEGSTPASPP